MILNKDICALNERFLVMLSTGRDSVIMTDILCRYYDKSKLIFVYLWLYPKGVLNYRDEYINSIEEKYSIIINYEPHFELWMIKKQMPKISFSEQRDFLMKKYNCSRVCYGWRKNESFQRNIILSHAPNGIPIDKKINSDFKEDEYKDPKSHIYPIGNFNKKMIDKYVIKEKIELSPEYKHDLRDINFFNGIYSKWLHDTYPNDFLKASKYDNNILKEYNRIVFNDK